MRAKIDRPNLLWRGFALGGTATLAVLSVSDDAWDWWETNVTDALPREVVRGLFVGTVSLHLVEAALARGKAKRAGVDQPGAWGRTALLYGFPTLRRLKKHIRTLDVADDAEVGDAEMVVIAIDEAV